MYHFARFSYKMVKQYQCSITSNYIRVRGKCSECIFMHFYKVENSTEFNTCKFDYKTDVTIIESVIQMTSGAT